jgi:hypothetical protein
MARDTRSLDPQLHRPGFDLREVEDVVDQRQEVLRGGMDILGLRDQVQRWCDCEWVAVPRWLRRVPRHAFRHEIV